MTTTTKTTATFDFSTIRKLNSNFSAAREAFGWPEPNDGEYLSAYEQRATSMDIDGRPEPDPALLGLMLYEGVGVKSGDPGSDQINRTLNGVFYEIVDYEWRFSGPDEDDDLFRWMPDKRKFLRDHDNFRDEWLEAKRMIPKKLRVDPEWNGERWVDTCDAWHVAVSNAIDALNIDEFLRKAVQKAMSDTIGKAVREALGPSLAKMGKEKKGEEA